MSSFHFREEALERKTTFTEYVTKTKPTLTLYGNVDFNQLRETKEFMYTTSYNSLEKQINNNILNDALFLRDIFGSKFQ